MSIIAVIELEVRIRVVILVTKKKEYGPRAEGVVADHLFVRLIISLRSEQMRMQNYYICLRMPEHSLSMLKSIKYTSQTTIGTSVCKSDLYRDLYTRCN